MKKQILILSLVALVAALLTSCNGILGGIYDLPEDDSFSGFGFVKPSEGGKEGTIYINSSEYTRWIYIDFHKRTIDSVEIAPDMKDPAEWDLAIHRYDTKTNGGEALETGFTGFGVLKASGKMPEGNYVKDVMTDKKIIVDMSGMMEGKIGYAKSLYNPELSKWLNVNIKVMPPEYTLSEKVYILKLKDGTAAALRLRNFMNNEKIKGYMTINYIYPFKPENS